MERRTFMKATALLASSPAAVYAAQAPALSTEIGLLGGMIERHDEILSRCRDLCQFIDDALDAHECPSSGEVKARELGADHRPLGEDVIFYSDSQIDQYIDRKIGAARWHVENCISPRFHESRIERFELDRGRAKDMLAERNAIYRKYELDAGVVSAEEKSDLLASQVEALQTEIIGWRCETLDEVALKASFVSNNWVALGADAVRQALGMLVAGKVVHG